ncbi:MAG: division/cell wall cluster transcriptional repressor MraZ [Nitrospira sp.]|nr:division/cell wall cluster transcriptional repressor MraZ [Nitrospira sp.]
MPAFSGKHYFTVDLKGRIIIPAPFREIISSNYSTKLYITNHSSEKCLCIYPLEEWNKLLEQVRTKPRSDKYIKYLMQRVIGSAVEMEMDKQGRILIPASLREDSKINTNIVIVGQLERIELWDRDEYDVLFEPSNMDKEDLERGLAVHGL